MEDPAISDNGFPDLLNDGSDVPFHGTPACTIVFCNSRVQMFGNKAQIFRM